MYTISAIPTYLIYDAISWIMKTDSEYARFFRMRAGFREEIRATVDQLKAELIMREGEPLPTSCFNCGRPTDGRIISDDHPFCPSCYFGILAVLAGGGLPSAVPNSPGSVAKQFNVDTKYTESREQIASRLGVPVKMLEENGFFTE